jgi:hypothetical protein
MTWAFLIAGPAAGLIGLILLLRPGPSVQAEAPQEALVRPSAAPLAPPRAKAELPTK